MILHIIELVVCVVSMSLHAVGLYLLCCLRGSPNLNGSQRIFLMNLSLAEFCVMFCELVKSVAMLIPSDAGRDFVSILQLAGFSLISYFAMIYLTIDRFFELYLNLKYPLYWNERRSRHLMTSMWVFSTSIALAICFLFQYCNVDYIRICYIYFYPTLEALFLVVALFTYGYVIKTSCRVISTRMKILPLQEVFDSKTVAVLKCKTDRRFEVFRHPTFYIPTSLVVTFIIFLVIPDLLYLGNILTKTYMSDQYEAAIFMTYFISFTCDAVIYIFLSPPVRCLFLKKFFRRKN